MISPVLRTVPAQTMCDRRRLRFYRRKHRLGNIRIRATTGLRKKERPEWRGLHSGRWAKPRDATSTQAGATSAGKGYANRPGGEMGIRNPTTVSLRNRPTHTTRTCFPFGSGTSRTLLGEIDRLHPQHPLARYAFDEVVMPIDFVLFLFSIVLAGTSVRMLRPVPIKLPHRLTNRQALPRCIGLRGSRAAARKMTAV